MFNDVFDDVYHHLCFDLGNIFQNIQKSIPSFTKNDNPLRIFGNDFRNQTLSGSPKLNRPGTDSPISDTHRGGCICLHENFLKCIIPYDPDWTGIFTSKDGGYTMMSIYYE